MLVHTDEDGNLVQIGLYRRNGVFCAAPELTSFSNGAHLLQEIIVATELEDLILKVHARYKIAIDEINLEELHCEEIH